MSGRRRSGRRNGRAALSALLFAACGTVAGLTAVAAAQQPPSEEAPTSLGDLFGSLLEPPRLGVVSLLVEPSDARIRIDHRVLAPVPAPPVAEDEIPEPARPAAQAALSVGDHVAEVSRPGYLPTLAAFTVVEDEEAQVAVALKRESAAVRLRASPADATILIDGFERADASGRAAPGWTLPRAAGGRSRNDLSPEVWIADLTVGVHLLEVRKEGFRTHRRRLEVTDLADYLLAPIVLEPEEGLLLLEGLPDDARVLANGREVQVDRSKLKPEARVAPGAIDLMVTRGIHGHFETRIVVEDGSRNEVEIELKPSLAFLGIFGADANGRRAVESALDFLKDRSQYIVLDRASAAAAAFSDLEGIDADTLRDRDAARRDLDWRAIQRRMQEAAPAALYLAAVLNDDLVADAVDLWWWSAAPGPARPDVMTLEIQDDRLDGDGARRLVRFLRAEAASERRTPRLGIGFVASLKTGTPVVATVASDGPAAHAGIAPGMEVLRIDGEAASSLRLAAVLEGLKPGGTIEMETADPDDQPGRNRARGRDPKSRRGVVRTVEPEWVWKQLPPLAPDLMPAAAAARLIRELNDPAEAPAWLLELDLANLSIATGDTESAVRRLQRIDVPDREGLGAGTARYALGLAFADLATAGGDEYRTLALDVFRELADAERGRLGDDRGPQVAPRAALRAAALSDGRSAAAKMERDMERDAVEPP